MGQPLLANSPRVPSPSVPACMPLRPRHVGRTARIARESVAVANRTASTMVQWAQEMAAPPLARAPNGETIAVHAPLSSSIGVNVDFSGQFGVVFYGQCLIWAGMGHWMNQVDSANLFRFTGRPRQLLFGESCCGCSRDHVVVFTRRTRPEVGCGSLHDAAPGYGPAPLCGRLCVAARPCMRVRVGDDEHGHHSVMRCSKRICGAGSTLLAKHGIPCVEGFPVFLAMVRSPSSTDPSVIAK